MGSNIWIPARLKSEGIDTFIWVPGTRLKELIRRIEQDEGVYSIGATREEEAIAIAAGAYLGGRKPIVIMQSSGLANSLNALCELLLAYRLPIPILVSVRGKAGEQNPVHVEFGKRLEQILEVLNIPYWHLKSPEDLKEAIQSCYTLKKTVAILMV